MFSSKPDIRLSYCLVHRACVQPHDKQYFLQAQCLYSTVNELCCAVSFFLQRALWTEWSSSFHGRSWCCCTSPCQTVRSHAGRISLCSPFFFPLCGSLSSHTSWCGWYVCLSFGIICLFNTAWIVFTLFMFMQCHYSIICLICSVCLLLCAGDDYRIHTWNTWCYNGHHFSCSRH